MDKEKAKLVKNCRTCKFLMKVTRGFACRMRRSNINIDCERIDCPVYEMADMEVH